jgi:putative membrane protein
MKLIGFVILLLIIVLGVTFSMLNAETVHFNYYVGQKNLALSLLLGLSLLVGFFLGWLMMFFSLISHKARMSSLRRKLKIAEKEIQNLRHIPIKNTH